MKESCNLPPQKGNLLIVDDNPNNLRLLMEILTAQGYRVRLAKDGSRALTLAQLELPELILLDIMMPGMDGFEVCRQLKADEKTRDVPVIFISALDATFDKVKAFEVGGVDFVTKPLKSEEVLARVRTHLSLHRLQLRLEKQNAQLENYRNHLEDLVAERTAEVNESRQRLSAVLKSVPDCLLVLDLEGRLVLVNRSTERLFGISSQRLRESWSPSLLGERFCRSSFPGF